MENTDAIKKLVKGFAKQAYPDYKGRKFSMELAKQYFMSNYWSEGSRNYCVAIDLATGKVHEPSDASQNPFNTVAHNTVVIPPGIGILEHCIFCGKDMGIRLYVSPGNCLTSNNTKELTPCT
jgi:hypothetical protein